MKIDEVVKYHEDWVKIAIFHGATKESSADIIQNVYVKLTQMQIDEGCLSRIEYNGQPNKGYLFSVIRSETYKYLKREGKYCGLGDECSSMEYEEVDHKAIEERYSQIKKAMKTELHWFSRMVFEIYVNDNHSIRSLAEATGIGRGTIQYEIKNVKETIKEYAATRA